MVAPLPALRIGIYGPEEAASSRSRRCNLWSVGYAAAVRAAGATPVPLGEKPAGRSWAAVLRGVQGVVWTGSARALGPVTRDEAGLAAWCRQTCLPLLAVDPALHALNTALGGTLYLDLARELPEALLHRHPPEKGLRHAISVFAGTRLAGLYGKGEFVINSEHCRGICRPAPGFRVCAQALDGVVEAIEAEAGDWFALGVQWRPASATASGLDIQLFRGLVAACRRRRQGPRKRRPAACTSAA